MGFNSAFKGLNPFSFPQLLQNWCSDGVTSEIST